MASFLKGFHNHIIDVDHQIAPYFVREYHIHYILIGGICVLQSNRHGIVILITMVRHENYFGSFQRLYFYLVIIGVSVHEAQSLIIEDSSISLSILGKEYESLGHVSFI